MRYLKNKKRVAVITGASSGMGREFAKIIGREYNSVDELWLIARRKDMLEELREEINKPCIVIDKDITDDSFNEFFRKMLKQENAGIKFLINCAGFGILGSVEDAPYETSIGMVNTNCLGLVSITHLCLAYMMENSRIINLASSAAFLPQPDFAIYAATKSFVLSFSKALSREVRYKKVFVTAVCPGPVATDFFRIAESGKKRPWFKDLFMSDCHSVVKKALDDSINRKEMSIYGFEMKAFFVLTRIIPDFLLLGIVDMISGERKNASKE